MILLNNNVVLITGVNGFIGRNLANYYLQKGKTVVGVGRDENLNIGTGEYYKINYFSGELSEMLRKLQPEIILHCAGTANVSFSETHPDTDFEANFLLPRILLETVRKYTPYSRIILFSSAAVYGNSEVLPIKEEARKRPISPYALHKLLMEQMAEYYKQNFHLDIIILRIFSAYGNGLRKQIFWDMFQKFKTQKKLLLGGTGKETRDFIHIKDLINAIDLIINSNNKKEYIYNVANGEEILIERVAEIFSEKLQKKYKLEKVPVEFSGIAREGNPINWCADIQKIQNLGYKQLITIEEGIYDYVDWLLSDGDSL